MKELGRFDHQTEINELKTKCYDLDGTNYYL